MRNALVYEFYREHDIGASIAICSNLPGAAGMSTSSAVVCAIYMVLARVNRLEARSEWKRSLSTPERLYEYLGTIENGQDFDQVISSWSVHSFWSTPRFDLLEF